ncbi:MAG: GNAT family N-acetyltransferase [Pirellulaceae bacterium]
MTSTEIIEFTDSVVDDTNGLFEFLQPFVAAQQLLERTLDEIRHLTKHGFVARNQGQIIGFAAVEVYSRKLGEIQCLAVSPHFQDRGIGRGLVSRCVDRARELGILELMAISASENLFKNCGFDYSLPNQKRALFIQPQINHG